MYLGFGGGEIGLYQAATLALRVLLLLLRCCGGALFAMETRFPRTSLSCSQEELEGEDATVVKRKSRKRAWEEDEDAGKLSCTLGSLAGCRFWH